MKKKVYINAHACISPQETFGTDSFLQEENILSASPMRSVEPVYKEYINRRILRRMGRMVRMGVCAATKVLKEAEVTNPDAILVGTGIGCLEDTEKFLTSIYESDENIASPNQFIQSTHNTVAAQIALMLGCNNYNFTYVHRGFSFESALVDSILHVQEAGDDPVNVIVGACDELTNMYMEVTSKLVNWRADNNEEAEKVILGQGITQGEGAAFFNVSNIKDEKSIAELEALHLVYKPKSSDELQHEVESFLAREELKVEDIDLVILGYDGSSGQTSDYNKVVDSMFDNLPLGVYKHLCGEYKTASAFAMWLTVEMIKEQSLPSFVHLNDIVPAQIKRVLIFNNYNNSNYVLSLLSHV